jgi:S1-C subfamily serine protease
MRIRLQAMLAVFLLATCGTAASGEVADRFRQVSDAVVIIGTQQTMLLASSHGLQQSSAGNIGSGVLISRDGKIMTAAHLVQAASVIKVKFQGGQVIDAHVVASAPLADVALLQLERVPKDAVVARLGDSSLASIGDPVFVVGAPYGIAHTLTVGYLSARHQRNGVMGGFETGELFQTDAAVNQGNSGGPMFNMAGEVIGIVSHILSRSGGFEGLGFAVTSDTAKQLLLEEHAFWTGFEGSTLTGPLAEMFNLPQPFGVLVEHVADNSPASRLGLRPGTVPARIGAQEFLLGGDIILSVMDIPLMQNDDTYRKIQAQLRCTDPGETLSVSVLREGEILQLSTPCLVER